MALDPLYWQTSLLLNLDVAGTTLLDISPTPKTGTCSGHAAITTAQPAVGTGSLALDGTGDYVTYSQHADFDMGSGDFCVEFFYRPTNAAGTLEQLVAYIKPLVGGSSDICYGILRQTTGKIKAFFYTSVPAEVSAEQASATMVAGTQYHIAMVRVGLVLNLYIDGALAASGAITTPGNSNTPTGRELYIGKYDSGATRHPTGYIDQVRITKGQARYTAAFTKPSAIWEATPPGTGSAVLTAPMATLATAAGATASLSAPMGTLIALAAGRTELTAPMGTLIATGHDSTGERSFAGTAPMGTLQALGGAKATLSAPMGTLIASVTVPVSVTAELVSPMGTLLASGTVGVSMRADLRLSSAGTVEAYSGGNAALVAPMGTLNAIAAVGVLAHFAGTAPMGSLSALATTGIVVRAELTAPMLVPTPSARATLTAPMGFLTAYGHAVVTTTYEAYAVNLKPGDRMPNQVTRYTNYPFNQIVRFQGNYYGVASDGLYLLGGDTDYHAVTPTGPSWAVKTAITDFGSSMNKVTRETFLGARLGPAVSASVSIGEAADVTYVAKILRGQKAQNHRVKYGKGLEARYWSFGFSDAAGGQAEIDTLEFDMRETGRKL